MSRTLKLLTIFGAIFLIVATFFLLAIPSLMRCRVAAPSRQEPILIRSSPVASIEADLPTDVYRGPATHDTEAYDRIYENPFLETTRHPLSTFSIDVDTASYSNVRRFLAVGRLPPKDAVRIEELINYFSYEYAAPEGRAPFSLSAEISHCPWNPKHLLAHIGLQGREIEPAKLPPRNLVFLIDVSGSMNDPFKLPLLKSAMGLLVETLRRQDRVSIVVYAGSSGLLLPPTPGDDKRRLHHALGSLNARGSTVGGEGIILAYKVAAESFIEDGVNRVILATDGDFNVGITNEGDLVRLIEEKREAGILLSILGFGTGNLKDSTMEKLADKGNGNYSYIDSLHEARKVLVAESAGTLVTIAKDVKIQIEFNPHYVSAHRLIGYENRLLRAEDFNDDRKDAGELGAGHTVTALYEIVPKGVEVDLPGVDPLKYQEPPRVSNGAEGDELMTVKLRYKSPQGDTSERLVFPVQHVVTEPASVDFRFSSAVAGFGMLLRDSEYKGTATYSQIVALARESKGSDPYGYRAEFIKLVGLAEDLSEMAGEGRM